MLRAGVELPETFQNVPELRPGLQLYIEAFFELDSERTHGDTLNPIPSSKIREYARDYELDEEQAEDLLFHIRGMDTDHLKRLGKRLKEKQKHGPNTKSPSKPPRQNRR
jgi:hypothetical protein